MWSCFRPRCVMECLIRWSLSFPQQLRLLSDNEKAKILEAKVNCYSLKYTLEMCYLCCFCSEHSHVEETDK